MKICWKENGIGINENLVYGIETQKYRKHFSHDYKHTIEPLTS
jgi:hypothetical protein